MPYTERELHRSLELKQNLEVLDPDSIKPWVFGSYMDTLQERYAKINTGMLLAMALLSNLKEDHPNLRDNDVAMNTYEHIQFDIAQEIDDQRDIMRMLGR